MTLTLTQLYDTDMNMQRCTHRWPWHLHNYMTLTWIHKDDFDIDTIIWHWHKYTEMTLILMEIC